MSTAHFISSQIVAGVWEGGLADAGDAQPSLTATHEGRALEGVSVTKAADIWQVRVPIPRDLINDGVQTVLIQDANGTILGSFAILAGEVLAQDLRAEIALLRSELDILKQAFRQHCNES